MNSNKKSEINNSIKELILKSPDIDEKTKLEMIEALDKKSLDPFLKSFLGSFLGKAAYDMFKNFFD